VTLDLHSHIKGLYLELYFIAVTVTGAIWLCVVLPALAQRRHRRVAALLDLFDTGTAEMGGRGLIRGYYNRPSVAGLFHGRPTSVSTQPGLVGNIRFCVSGDFYLPFEVGEKTSRELGAIRNVLKRLAGGFWVLIYISLGLKSIAHEISFWKLVAAVVLCYFILALVVGCYAKSMGYFDEGP
jgi:hypothetical protein